MYPYKLIIIDADGFDIRVVLSTLEKQVNRYCSLGYKPVGNFVSFTSEDMLVCIVQQMVLKDPNDKEKEVDLEKLKEQLEDDTK